MNGFIENSETEILCRLRKGDELAFEILFYSYKNRVKGFVHKMLPPHISSDRIVQETFVRIWKKRDKIDPSKNFSAYLFTISKNLILDELKTSISKKMVYVENYVLEEIIHEQEVVETTEEELEEMLQKGIEKLPERRRQIFSLSRFEGLSYKQIAVRLNISENTVDTQIRKSLQFLRQELSNFL